MTTSSMKPPPRVFGFGIESFRPSPRRSRRISPPASHHRPSQPRRCPRSPCLGRLGVRLSRRLTSRLRLGGRLLGRLCLSDRLLAGLRLRLLGLGGLLSLRLGLWLGRLDLTGLGRGSLLSLGSLRLGRLGLGLGIFLRLADALGIRRLGLRRGDRSRDQLLVDAPAPLGDASRLADAAAQVIKLRPPHVAAGGDLQFLDLRRVQRKGPLDADAKGLLADGEGLAHSRALSLDHDALEDLGAAASALNDLEVDAHAIARIKGRQTLPYLTALDVLDDAAHAKKDRRARTGLRAVAEW